MMTKCTHSPFNSCYYSSINEDGWKCLNCDEKLGYRPDLDRKLICAKVRGLLLDMHEHKFIHVSNGSMGDCIVENVSEKCRKNNMYDQHFIFRMILEDPNISGHSKYWQEKMMETLKP